MNKIEEAHTILDKFKDDEDCRSITIKINKDAGVVWSQLDYNVKTDRKDPLRYDRVIAKRAETHGVDIDVASALIRRIERVVEGGSDDDIRVINDNVYVTSSFKFFRSMNALKLRKPLIKVLGGKTRNTVDKKTLYVIKMSK